MLAIENLEVVYDDVVLVVRGVSLRLPEGGIATERVTDWRDRWDLLGLA